MALSETFFGIRSGSTSSLTFAKGAGGTQITKDKVSEVTDAKTEKQMLARYTLAQAVAFYKRFLKGFFLGAFEDKKAKENDYNVFIRKNRRLGCIYTPEQLSDERVPIVGKWKMSQGSLTPLRLDNQFRFLDRKKLKYFITHDDIVGEEGKQLTVGTLSNMLMKVCPEVARGEVLTVVLLKTQCYPLDRPPYIEVQEPDGHFIVWQTVVDDTSTKLTPATLFPLQNHGTMMKIKSDGAWGACMIRSIVTSKHFATSSQNIILHGDWESCYQAMRYYGHKPDKISAWARECAQLWGASEPGILEGALATDS